MNVVTAVMDAGAAVRDGDDGGDVVRGVYVHVDISPRACLEACGVDNLPTTGGGVSEMILLVGIVLLVAGVSLVATRFIRRRRHSRE